MWNKLIKNDRGFTGLEAAIVLIAFVVVAAVFSYVMLGAGFFTTQKSQEVVHTGVTQASSSIELSGDVISTENAGSTGLKTVTMCVQLTSGGSPVDFANTLLVVSAPGIPPSELTKGAAASATNFVISNKYNANADDILDPGEQFDLQIDLDAVAQAAPTATHIGTNQDFQVQIEPPRGAPYIVHRTAPAVLKAIMPLY
jgi:archaeal flagellin FlaB